MRWKHHLMRIALRNRLVEEKTTLQNLSFQCNFSVLAAGGSFVSCSRQWTSGTQWSIRVLFITDGVLLPTIMLLLLLLKVVVGDLAWLMIYSRPKLTNNKVHN